MWTMLLSSGVKPTAAFGFLTVTQIYSSPRPVSAVGYFTKTYIYKESP